MTKEKLELGKLAMSLWVIIYVKGDDVIYRSTKAEIKKKWKHSKSGENNKGRN